MTVRRATEADVDGALAVFAGVVEEGNWLGTEPGFDRAERRDGFAGLVHDQRRALLVAVADGADGADGAAPDVVGMSSLEVAPYGVAGFGMCVAAPWRRQGVGGALVTAALAEARRMGAHKMSLEVWPHNEAAIRLYERHGFAMEGRRRRHWRRRSGELWDSVIMGLVLEEERA